MGGVFEGLTVIELADRRNQWAGKLLSDGGARVIQIEPVNGSEGRWCGPFVNDEPNPDRCIDYWWYNTGKQSLTVDLGRLPGQDLVRRLLLSADVFLESTRPGTLAASGLDYDSLKDANPGLIYTSVTDFGQDGPWVGLEMNDHAHLALGGQMASSGYSDPTATPIGGHGHQTWHLGCVFAVHGIALTLFDRLTSGLGQQIDVSIHDCCAMCTEGAVPQYLYDGNTLFRQTGMHAAARRQPDLELPTADGKYVMASTAVFGNHSWANLVKWMVEKGVAEDLTDEKYRDETIRAREYGQGTAIRDGIRRLVSVCDAEEAFHRAQSMGITWTVIHAPEENYDLPHFAQRGFWRDVEQEEIGRAVRFPRGPFLSDELQIEPRGRAPHLGEHTKQILKSDLGLSDTQIDSLAAAGVIR